MDLKDWIRDVPDYPQPGILFRDLTPLGSPSDEALRRALTEPARKCGYRFEDDQMPEELVAAILAVRSAR